METRNRHRVASGGLPGGPKTHVDVKGGNVRCVRPIYGVAVVVLLTLQACASIPKPSGAMSHSAPRCRPSVYVAQTAYRVGAAREIAWSIIFDEATRAALESQTRVGVDGLDHLVLNSLDCLIDETVKDVCRRGWRHDPQIAVDREDGRLEANGYCNR